MTIDQELNAALERLAAQKNEPRVKEWLATRKKAGQDLDPEKTAEVMWIHAQTLDPYGVCREMPGELNSVGREWFARAVGSDIWISYDDLPRAVVERLEQRIAAGDFDQISALPEIKRLEALTTEEAWEMMQRSLSLDIDTTYYKIEDCTRLADGGFQLVVREHHGGTE